MSGLTFILKRHFLLLLKTQRSRRYLIKTFIIGLFHQNTQLPSCVYSVKACSVTINTGGCGLPEPGAELGQEPGQGAGQEPGQGAGHQPSGHHLFWAGAQAAGERL